MTDLWLIMNYDPRPLSRTFSARDALLLRHVLLLLGFVGSIAFIICMFGDKEQGIFVLKPSLFFI
jgi:hypothetical protein